jgi:hypothetical protein
MLHVGNQRQANGCTATDIIALAAAFDGTPLSQAAAALSICAA